MSNTINEAGGDSNLNDAGDADFVMEEHSSDSSNEVELVASKASVRKKCWLYKSTLLTVDAIKQLKLAS